MAKLKKDGTPRKINPNSLANLQGPILSADDPRHQMLKNTQGQYASKRHLTNAFLTAMAQDFENYGAEAITIVRETQPALYLKIIADMVPKEESKNVNIESTQVTHEVRTLSVIGERLADIIQPSRATIDITPPIED